MKIHLPQDQLLGYVQNILIAFVAISAIAMAAIGRIRLYRRCISLQEGSTIDDTLFSHILIGSYIDPYIAIYVYVHID